MINLTVLILCVYLQLHSPVYTNLTYLGITLVLVLVQSSAVTFTVDCPE